MAQSDLTRIVEPACRALAEQLHFELVEVELAREGGDRTLRITIDKPDGITLQDCETYHRAAIPLVERVDYDFLEVSSPGIDRPLKTPQDYERHAGERVEVHLYRPIDKRRRFEGELVGLDAGEVVLEEGGAQRRFPLRDVSLCKPVIEITEEELLAAEGGTLSADEARDTDGQDEEGDA